MKLYDYIAEADAAYRNAIDYDIKCKWLDRLEAMLTERLSDRIPEGTEIVGVHPYDEVYVAYLKMKCADAVEDSDRYNIYLTQFNEARENLIAYYVRRYPKNKKVGWKNVL